MAETFAWREGLGEPIKRAWGFYLVIAASTLVARAGNYLGLDPIKALVYSATINGVISPPLLFIIVRLSSRRAVMGAYTSGRWSIGWGWAACAAMTIATVAYFVTLIG